MKTRKEWIKLGRIVKEFESTRYFSNKNNALYAEDQTRKLKKGDLDNKVIIRDNSPVLVDILRDPHFMMNVPKNIPVFEQLTIYFKQGFISYEKFKSLLKAFK